MHTGKLVFAQLTAHLPRTQFAKGVARYARSHAPLRFTHWDQLLSMVFAQLTARTSLRDIATSLQAQSAKLYHAGFRGHVARSTLADANEQRDWRIFEAFAKHLIAVARQLYSRDDLTVELRDRCWRHSGRRQPG